MTKATLLNMAAIARATQDVDKVIDLLEALIAKLPNENPVGRSGGVGGPRPASSGATANNLTQ